MNFLFLPLIVGGSAHCGSAAFGRVQETPLNTIYNQENDLYSVYGYDYGYFEPGTPEALDPTLILTALFVGLGAAGLGLSLLNILNLSTDDENQWDYQNRGADWPEIQCLTGSYQSPININPSRAKKRLPFLKSGLTFSSGYSTLQRGMVTNDGHSIKFTVDESNRAGISGGPLASSYTLAQFHLHWGSRRGQGSEHTVNGKRYDAELHLVHYKSSYDSFAAAFDDAQPDSLAVLAIFLEEDNGVTDSDSINSLRLAARELALSSNRNSKSVAYHNWNMIQNPSIPLTSTWEKSPEFPEYVTHKLVGAPTPSLDMDVRLDDFTSDLGSDSVIPLKNERTGIYHYAGSLTTPDCNEYVQWLINDKPLKISKNGLLKELRSNLDINGNPLVDNYRPIQANANTLYHYGLWIKKTDAKKIEKMKL